MAADPWRISWRDREDESIVSATESVLVTVYGGSVKGATDILAQFTLPVHCRTTETRMEWYGPSHAEITHKVTESFWVTRLEYGVTESARRLGAVTARAKNIDNALVDRDDGSHTLTIGLPDVLTWLALADLAEADSGG